MKVLERATMPNGVKIQLEDWSEDNTQEFPNLYGLTIGAYPVSQIWDKYGIIKRGETFRLDISMSSYKGYTNQNVRKDYEALKRGEKTLEDLSDHFWDGEKDKRRLGMDR